jgi:DNA-binding CsgD family transcriptional regulator
MLTPLEGRVLALVAQGYSDQEIAHVLGISVHTAKHAVRNSLVRLGARNRTEAAVRALADGQLAEETIATSGTDGSNERSDALDPGGPAIQHAGVVRR